MQKIKTGLLFLLIGAMSVFFIEVFFNGNTSTAYQAEDLDEVHENHLDQRVNHHLDQLARKVELQSLKAESVAKEVELLRISSSSLHHGQIDFKELDEENHTNQNTGEYKGFTEQIDAHINDMDLESRRQALREKEEQKRKAELMKLYQKRARDAGFEMVIKDGQAVGIKPRRSRKSRISF